MFYVSPRTQIEIFLETSWWIALCPQLSLFTFSSLTNNIRIYNRIYTQWPVPFWHSAGSLDYRGYRMIEGSQRSKKDTFVK
jgi:hypothetical protein